MFDDKEIDNKQLSKNEAEILLFNQNIYERKSTMDLNGNYVFPTDLIAKTPNMAHSSSTFYLFKV